MEVNVVMENVIRYLVLVVIAKMFIEEFDFITAAVCLLIHAAVVAVAVVAIGLVFGSSVGIFLLFVTLVSMAAWFMILMWKYELELNQTIVLSIFYSVVTWVIVTLLGKL